MFEFFGSIFIRTETLKLEKALMLYGEGANGKSVFYELMNALLGEKNVSSFSLHSLMDQTGYYRAMLANKLLNYASEISGELEAGMFKQLASGEPVPARMIYSAPIMVRDYSKLAFNCNTLPKNVEHTHAYFRRFLIIPFTVTIPDQEQDKELVQKIIGAGELSGIFNWVLDGLKRLLSQKGFSKCDAIERELAKYKSESDNVNMFLVENNYEEYLESYISVKELGTEYGEFCKAFRYMPLNHGNFVKRLRALGVRVEKRNTGLVAFIKKDELKETNGELTKTEIYAIESLWENEKKNELDAVVTKSDTIVTKSEITEVASASVAIDVKKSEGDVTGSIPIDMEKLWETIDDEVELPNSENSNINPTNNDKQA